MEVMTSILSWEIIRRDGPYLSEMVDDERRTQLTTVCRSWCLLIRAHAAFWTTIRNDDWAYDVAVQRSQNALLRIEYSGTTVNDALAFLRRIRATRSRWHSVEIRFHPFQISDTPSASSTSGSDSDSDSLSEFGSNPMGAEARFFFNLFGPTLTVLEIDTLPGHIGFHGATLPLGECPALRRLVTRNISIEVSFTTPREQLPCLSHLSMSGFLETARQWRTILLIIAASHDMVELYLTPHRTGLKRVGQLGLEDLDVEEPPAQLLQLPKLRKLDISSMPPRTLDLFVRHTVLNPDLLAKLHLQAYSPLEGTLAALFDPYESSVARAIQALSASQSEADLSASFDRYDCLIYSAGGPKTTSVHIQIDAPQAISKVFLLPSPFAYPQAPRLHISLSAFSAYSFNTSTLESILSATPLSISCRIINEELSAETIKLLMGQPDHFAWWWPQLASLTLGTDSTVGPIWKDLVDLVAIRSEGFRARLCRSKLMVYDPSGLIISGNGTSLH